MEVDLNRTEQEKLDNSINVIKEAIKRIEEWWLKIIYILMIIFR
jgi:malate/lactate dehydrogenase